MSIDIRTNFNTNVNIKTDTNIKVNKFGLTLFSSLSPPLSPLFVIVVIVISDITKLILIQPVIGILMILSVFFFFSQIFSLLL